MAGPLLTTKLYAPRLRADLVPRPRLVARLDDGLRRGQGVTLISAPAGFGKTTIVSEWLAAHDGPAAWFSLDEGDSDPTRFLHYLAASLAGADASLGAGALELLASPQAPPPESVATMLLNDAAGLETPIVLVIDDYHLIRSLDVHDVLAFLVEHLPPPLHIVIMTREDPPLPLPTMRARGKINELRERDLRFTDEEAAAFLNQTMGLNLAPEAVAALRARTEGWIAGLQLAALALQERPGDVAGFIDAFTGDNRYIMDYLLAEVLDRQPENVQEFLRQTSLLDRLNGPLCDAVTGGSDSQAILESLDDANLFLLPLDHRREWYRYHRLFAEVLRATLDPAEQAELHGRAAAWYEDSGSPSEAVEHALDAASVTGDLADVERLIRVAARDTLMQGGLTTLRGWLDALPDARIRTDVELAMYRAWSAALSGDLRRAEEYLDVAEERLAAGDERPVDAGSLAVLGSFIDVLYRRNYEEAIRLAQDALDQLPPDQVQWRIIALWALAESLERTRPIGEAIAAFQQARDAGLSLGNQVFVATIEMSLAMALNNHAERHAAISVCEEALRRYTGEGGRVSPVAALIYSRLGTLHYEANDLAAARDAHEQGRLLSDQLNLGGELTFAKALAAPTFYALGETDTALESLVEARRVAEGAAHTEAGWILAMEAGMRLGRGDLPFARRWADTAKFSIEDTPDYLTLDEHLAFTRLLIAEDRLDEARAWLATMEDFTRERELIRALVTVHVLGALAAARAYDHEAAKEKLTAAVELAASGEYYRAFLDEDPQVIALLSDVRHRAPIFVAHLLDHAGIPGVRPDIAAQPLIEPLSDRELEVLDLIATGLTNREIAERLYIAVGTVKTHVNNLYGKLEVGSRTEAIAKARALHILE